MKKLILLIMIFSVSSCRLMNLDGSSILTYSSCIITRSEAEFLDDRNMDLSQCWNASGFGYENREDALQACSEKVTAYIDDRYIISHSVSYAVKSSYCP